MSMLKSPLNRYLSFLDHRGKTFHIVIGFICTLLLGGIDYLADIVTGMDFTLAFFYLLPVSFVAWFAGRNAGIIIALACAATETIVYLTFNESLILIGWKSITGLGFFLVV